jgi:HAD superfamily hydrolase (TIGR01549 family)
MKFRGVFFDFGFVIGYPPAGLERRYLYLDWDGIDAILNDPALSRTIHPGVGREQLIHFFEREVYQVFLEHEQADGIDPLSNQLLLAKLPLIFDGPVDQTFVDRLLAFLDTMKFITIDPKAGEILAAFKHRGLYLALVSNMMLPGKLLRAKLEKAGLLASFDDLVISSEVGYIKPHPEIFRLALTHSRLKAEEVLFVGDSYAQDILGAKRVGLKTAWLNPCHQPGGKGCDQPPDYEIKALGEIAQIDLGLPDV